MRKFIFLTNLLLSSSVWAADLQEIMDRAQKEGVTPVGAAIQPADVRSLSAEYELNGMVLSPQQAVYVQVPETLRQGLVDFISIAHRQDPREENECHSEDPKRDCLPAYTSVEVLDEAMGLESLNWRCWGGVGSGPCDSKFAEIRSGTPETDNLYEWVQHGTRGWDGDRMRGSVHPSFLRVRNVGQDQVHVHKLILKIVPPRPTSQDLYTFSEGTELGDFESARGRHFPGKTAKGDYGHSLDMGKSVPVQHANLPVTATTGRNSVELPLRAGARLIAIDVAVGDMRRVPPGGNEEDYRGGAVLNIEWRRAGDVYEDLMKSENIGENGVMRTSPVDLQQRIQAGDRLRLTVPKGIAHIMAIRISYAE